MFRVPEAVFVLSWFVSPLLNTEKLTLMLKLSDIRLIFFLSWFMVLTLSLSLL